MDSFLRFFFLRDPIGEEMELQQMSSKSGDTSIEDILPFIEEQLPRDVSNDDANPRDISSTAEAVVPPDDLTNIDFMPRELVLAQSTRPPDASYQQILRVAQPLDRPVATARQRPPSLTGVLDVSDTSLIISPGGVPEDPCTFSECDTVEGGSPALPFGKELNFGLFGYNGTSSRSSKCIGCLAQSQAVFPSHSVRH